MHSHRSSIAALVEPASKPPHYSLILEYKILGTPCRGLWPVDKSEFYRANATECLVMALSMTDPTSRISLLKMAAKWSRLADLAAKNSGADLVYETPPARDVRGG
jgi:hypothetical protein